MRLERRLTRMERDLAPAMPASCPHCGEVDHREQERYRLVFDGDTGHAGPERCEVCGRAMAYRVYFDREG